MAKKEVEGVNALTQFGGIPMQLAKPFIDKFLSSVLSEAEDINQGLVQLDASGKVLWANKSALAIAGLEAKDVVGKRYSLLKIFAKGFALKSLPRAISSTSKFKNTYYVPIISVGNGIRDVKAELFPMKSGKLMVGYLVLLSDITDDKIMAERLAESEQRSRLILDNSLDVICIYDTTGVIEYAAGALERHGYSSKDLIGKRIIDFIHPEDQSAALATFRSALRGKPLPVTCRLRKKKGQYFYAEERGQLIRSPGRPFKILSIIRDVTKEREALEKEREYQSRYTAIVDKTDLVIFSYRLDDLTLTFVSPNCTRVFGYVQRSLIGKKLLDFVHPDDKQLVIDTISKSVKTGIDSTSFCRIQRLDKTYRHCKISGTMNRGQSGKYEVVTGVITDINDIRTAEYELKHKLELETAEGKIFSAFLSHANDDDSIEKSLQELSKVFGADAGFTFNVDESGKKMSIGHYWYGFKGKFFGKYIHDVPLAKFPSLIRLIKSNKHFSVSDVNEMKGFAANEKAFAKMIGIGSFIVMPLWTHGKLMGFIGFTCRHKNEWNKDSILLLSRAASLMSGTLEKIKAEKALKDSEAELKSLFDSIDDFLFVVDMRGRIVKTNKVAESMLGYSGSELLKKSFLDLHPPYTRHQAQATVQDMIKGNKDYCDIPFMTKSGKLIQVETHVTQGLWGQEKVLIGISRDTTERLAAARALKESEERYELIVKNSRQIAYTLNFIKRSVTWSGAVKPLTGHDPKGFASLSLEIWQGMMHPFDKQRVEALFKHAFRTQGKYKTEYRLRKKDGRYIFVEDIGSYTQSGLLVGSMKDITDRKLAEDAVKKKLTFQTIVSKITSRFVDVADLDSSINESLADLGELTQADRAYLFLVDESGDYYRNANEWCNRGVASQKDKLQQVPASEIKWFLDGLRRNKAMQVRNVAEIPTNGVKLRRFLEGLDITSFVSVPVEMSGRLIGFLGFDNTEKRGVWDDEMIHSLTFFSKVISTANLVRIKNEQFVESQRRFKETADLLPQIVVEVDTEGLITYANKEALSVFSLTGGNLSKKLNMLSFVHPDELERISTNFRKLINGEKLGLNEYRLVKKGGGIIHTIVNAHPIYHGDKIVGVRSSITDITDKKIAEEKLARFNEDLERQVKERTAELEKSNQNLYKQFSALESSTVGIAILNQEGMHIYVNPALAKIFGYSNPSEMMNRKWTDFYYPDEIRRLHNIVEKELVVKGHWQGDAVGKKKNGHPFDNEVTLNLLKDNSVVCIISDITERKNAEHMLKEQKLELEKAYSQLKKLDEMKDNFISSVSHELRTPLTSIQAYNQLMKDRVLGPVTTQQEDALSISLSSVKNLTNLINNMLDISKYESGNIFLNTSEFSIKGLVDELRREFSPTLETSHAVFRAPIDDSLTIRADKNRIEQVLRNLISNAIKYHGEKPIIITIHAEKAKGGTEIKVRDEGIGIDEVGMSNLFNRFYQVDQGMTRKIEGTGLGLSISKEIVKLHGGTIVADSKFGQYTEFRIFLPDRLRK